MPVDPKTCPYYEIAKRTAGIVVDSLAFRGDKPIVWNDVEQTVVCALLDAWEAGKAHAENNDRGFLEALEGIVK